MFLIDLPFIVVVVGFAAAVVYVCKLNHVF